MLSRNAYLPVIAEEVIESFKSYIPDFNAEIWFEFMGIPLKR
jgi:hypothetical protein